MSEPASSLPPLLRQAIVRDLRPVRPVASPARRAAWLGALALAGILFGVVRALDFGAPSLVGLLVAAAEWGAALALVWVAMREAVPGSSVGWTTALAMLGVGLSTQLAAAALLSTTVGSSWLGDGGFATGRQCLTGEGSLGLPLLAGSAWLLLRAFPLRARLASALGGAAAGLFADAAWHLVCVRTDLAHILVWHFGSTLVLAGAGYLVGIGIERRTAGRPIQGR